MSFLRAVQFHTVHFIMEQFHTVHFIMEQFYTVHFIMEQFQCSKLYYGTISIQNQYSTL